MQMAERLYTKSEVDQIIARAIKQWDTEQRQVETAEYVLPFLIECVEHTLHNRKPTTNMMSCSQQSIKVFHVNN